MADPLSVGGVVLGTVSLTFQVFSGCVKGKERFPIRLTHKHNWMVM